MKCNDFCLAPPSSLNPTSWPQWPASRYSSSRSQNSVQNHHVTCGAVRCQELKLSAIWSISPLLPPPTKKLQLFSLPTKTHQRLWSLETMLWNNVSHPSHTEAKLTWRQGSICWAKIKQLNQNRDLNLAKPKLPETTLVGYLRLPKRIVHGFQLKLWAVLFLVGSCQEQRRQARSQAGLLRLPSSGKV